MAGSVLVDAGFLVALLRQGDKHRKWAAERSFEFARPWHTCDAALSEAFHLLGEPGADALTAFLKRRSLLLSFDLGRDLDSVLTLMRKYADMPMSLADACLVRMTEILPTPVLLSTDSDFRIYRRHSRQVIPCVLPH